MKLRINQGQELVIGGYTVGTKTFDALIFGYYDGDRLITSRGRETASRRRCGRSSPGSSARWK